MRNKTNYKNLLLYFIMSYLFYSIFLIIHLPYFCFTLFVNWRRNKKFLGNKYNTSKILYHFVVLWRWSNKDRNVDKVIFWFRWVLVPIPPNLYWNDKLVSQTTFLDKCLLVLSRLSSKNPLYIGLHYVIL